MVVGIIAGPDRIADLDMAKAMERPGLYALPDTAITLARRTDAARQAGSQALALEGTGLAFQENPQPTIYYPARLAAERLGGQMFSAPPEMPPEQAAMHAAEAVLHRQVMADLTVETPPATQLPEALAA